MSSVRAAVTVAQSLSATGRHLLHMQLAIELGQDLQPVRGAVALDLTARDVQVRAWCALLRVQEGGMARGWRVEVQ